MFLPQKCWSDSICFSVYPVSHFIIYSQLRISVLKFENAYAISSHTFNGRTCSSMLGLKLLHVSNRGPWWRQYVSWRVRHWFKSSHKPERTYWQICEIWRISWFSFENNTFENVNNDHFPGLYGSTGPLHKETNTFQQCRLYPTEILFFLNFCYIRPR